MRRKMEGSSQPMTDGGTFGVPCEGVERSQRKEALRESEEKFFKVFHATPAFLAITTLADGRFIEVNESFERILGYRAEEVIGRSSLELNIWENRADRAAVIKTLHEAGKVRDLEAKFRG